MSEQLYAEVLDPLDCFLQQREIKRSISGQKRNLNQERAKALYDILSPEYLRIVELASEKGASRWLTVLPIDSSEFALHKSAFRDALCLRYGWPCKDLPSQCKCGNQLSVDHLLSCPMGGYPSLRHNEIRDITASFLSEVCRNVSIEPRLQELSGELLTHRSANTTPNARLDVAADGVWGSRFERFFLMLECSIPLLPPIVMDLLQTHIGNMKQTREDYMENVCGTSNKPHLFHLFFQLRGAWASLQDRFIEGWLVV